MLGVHHVVDNVLKDVTTALSFFSNTLEEMKSILKLLRFTTLRSNLRTAVPHPHKFHRFTWPLSPRFILDGRRKSQARSTLPRCVRSGMGWEANRCVLLLAWPSEAEHVASLPSSFRCQCKSVRRSRFWFLATIRHETSL